MSEIILYTSADGTTKVEVTFEEETFWLTQKRLSELFCVDVRTVNEHLQIGRTRRTVSYPEIPDNCH